MGDLFKSERELIATKTSEFMKTYISPYFLSESFPTEEGPKPNLLFVAESLDSPQAVKSRISLVTKCCPSN